MVMAARAKACPASAASVALTSVRRLNRSARTPVSSGSTAIGAEKHRPCRPSASAEWVSRYRTQAPAVLLIWVPAGETTWPESSRAKGGWASAPSRVSGRVGVVTWVRACGDRRAAEQSSHSSCQASSAAMRISARRNEAACSGETDGSR